MTIEKAPPEAGPSLSPVRLTRPHGRLRGQRQREVTRIVLSVYRSPATRFVVLVVLMIIQGALCLLAAYLIDLGISLMELWADLARKHLELTL